MFPSDAIQTYTALLFFLYEAVHAQSSFRARPPPLTSLPIRQQRILTYTYTYTALSLSDRAPWVMLLSTHPGNRTPRTQAKTGSHRLKFLLAQTDIFSHFMEGGKAASTKNAKKGAARRELHDEFDEDDEILKDDADPTHVTTRLQAQPTCIMGKMREYQLQGLNWLIHLYDNGINGILADEMGLGKTLQTISLLGYLHEFRGISGPHLIIVPKSTLGNWMREIKRWCPALRPTKFHGAKEERLRQKEEEVQPGKFDVCVTSFEMAIKEKSHLKKFHWRYLIIDEAHRIKNENSRLSVVVRIIKSNFRLLITGTPLQNNLHELWALLNFLLPEVFSSSDQFDEWFSAAAQDDGGQDEVVKQLHKVLRPFLLRRLKKEVEKNLPPKKETILQVGMSEMQKTWYKNCLQKDFEIVNSGGDRSRLLNVVMQLRKCCNHPYLFQGAEPGPPYTTGEHLVQNSGKMILLERLLVKLQARGSRVLIFSQMTRMLDILEDYCLFRGYKYCRIDGNTDGITREGMIDDFNVEGSEKFLFLLSTRAGGLGINLATADTVILYDSDWNPQVDLQAMDRAHRIGQKKEVSVFRFCVESSVEVKVIEKAYKKLALDALVIQQGRLQENQKSVNKDDLLSMVRYGAEKIFSATGGTVTDADVEAIIAKGEETTKELNTKLAAYTEKAMAFSLDGAQSLYEYEDPDDEPEALPEGEEFRAQVRQTWIDPPRRERKKNYNENDYYRNAISRGPSSKSSGPRLPKLPNMQDYQFFNVERIKKLHEIECAALRNAWLRDRASEDERVHMPEVQGLTEEEEAEKANLLEAGQREWTKRDYNAFVRACEKYGRPPPYGPGSVADIATEIEGKTQEEVREYAKVFWSKYKELGDADRVLRQVERGEAKIHRQVEIMNSLATKMNRYRNPWRELKPVYGTHKGKAFTEDEDRYILCMAHKLGYGEWEALKAEVRKSWMFRFDWFFKSRTPQELGRRCETLVRLVEKELEEDTEREKKSKRKASGSGGGSRKKQQA